MSESAIVKYDLPPYMLVHKADFRLKKWDDRIPTEVGYFKKSAVVAVVDRNVGDRIKSELDLIRDRHRKSCCLAGRTLDREVKNLLTKEGVRK